MANLVSAERISLALGTAQILDDVSLGVAEGDRIGVVGRNGGGKSTLIKVLAGEREPDSGRLTRAGGATLGLLHQDDALAPEWTVRESVLRDRPEHVWAADPRVRSVVEGLLGGMDAAAVGGWDRLVGPMSGGERRRMALARLLVDDPDLMLLDEPTNHLDVEGVAWLAQFLATRSKGGLVVITHDRWFLDAVATLTWEVVDGKVNSYEGGYAAFVLAKVERARIAQVTEERRANLARKELAWLRRGAPARTSKPRFRIEAANELIRNEPPPRDEVELMRFATTRLGKDVYDLIGATVRVGGPMADADPAGSAGAAGTGPKADGPGEAAAGGEAPASAPKTILDDVTWRIGPGDRYGIVGVNGAGKSTLLRTLLGQVPLEKGKLKTGKTVQAAYLSQEVRELDERAGWRVIEAVEEIRKFTILDKKEVNASSLAKRLGFSGPRQQTRVGELSGGERRRLQFLRLLMAEPNVLILDEPTNDLDIDTLTAMEDVLDGWAGTLLVVSHDRYLLERMTDRQIALLGDGKIRDLPGGVEQYLELRGAAVARAEAAEKKAARAAAQAPSSGTGASPAQLREARKDLARVEKQLEKVAAREAKVHAAMAEAATDYARMTELNGELAALAEEREGLEMEWLEAAEILG